MQNYGVAHRVPYGHGALNKVHVVEEKHEREGTGGHIKILVILVMFLMLMMIASIIISVVSLSNWNTKDSRDHYDGYDKYEYEKYKKYYYDHYGKTDAPQAPWAPPPQYPQTPVVVSTNVDNSCGKADVFTIAFGDDWGTHGYIDESEQCALRGWGLEVVLAACKAVDLTCKTMYAPLPWCLNYFSASEYEKQPVIGEGLLNKGISACAGWYPDAERSNVALFSDGYIRNPKVYLWYPNGRSTTLDSSTRIGFLHSGPFNEKCLARYITRLTGGSAVLRSFGNAADLLAALNKPTSDTSGVHMIFFDDLEAQPSLTIYNDDYMTCARGPAGLVTNKRHKAFVEQWNVGLEKIKGNGELRKICDNYNTEWCVKTYWV